MQKMNNVRKCNERTKYCRLPTISSERNIIIFIEKSAKGRRYFEKWILLCLLFYMKSPKEYDFILNNKDITKIGQYINKHEQLTVGKKDNVYFHI